MKLMYLIYNSLKEDYIFSESKDPYDTKTREEWGQLDENSLLKKLKENLDLKRNSIIYLNEEFPKDLKNSLEETFKDSKIKLEIKKNI